MIDDVGVGDVDVDADMTMNVNDALGGLRNYLDECGRDALFVDTRSRQREPIKNYRGRKTTLIQLQTGKGSFDELVICDLPSFRVAGDPRQGARCTASSRSTRETEKEQARPSVPVSEPVIPSAFLQERWWWW
jgi:hypothetical protein